MQRHTFPAAAAAAGGGGTGGHGGGRGRGQHRLTVNTRANGGGGGSGSTRQPHEHEQRYHRQQQQSSSSSPSHEQAPFHQQPRELREKSRGGGKRNSTSRGHDERRDSNSGKNGRPVSGGSGSGGHLTSGASSTLTSPSTATDTGTGPTSVTTDGVSVGSAGPSHDAATAHHHPASSSSSSSLTSPTDHGEPAALPPLPPASSRGALSHSTRASAASISGGVRNSSGSRSGSSSGARSGSGAHSPHHKGRRSSRGTARRQAALRHMCTDAAAAVAWATAMLAQHGLPLVASSTSDPAILAGLAGQCPACATGQQHDHHDADVTAGSLPHPFHTSGPLPQQHAFSSEEGTHDDDVDHGDDVDDGGCRIVGDDADGSSPDYHAERVTQPPSSSADVGNSGPVR